MEEFEELLEQGEALAGEGLLQDALSRFEAARELEPGNPEVAEATGRALLALDRLEEAEESFLEASRSITSGSPAGWASRRSRCEWTSLSTS